MSQQAPTIRPKRQERIVRLAVQGSELRPALDRHKALYRPDEILLMWVREGDQPWRRYSPQLSGPKIRKDGTDSKQRAHESFYRSEPPPWLQDLVARYDEQGREATA